MSPLQIRLATLADTDFIVQGNCQMALETESTHLDPERVTMGVKHLINHPALGCYYLAQRAGEILGQCMVTCEWSDWRCAPMWWFQSVYVAANARRQGVFSALHHHVHQAALEQGVAQLRLYVERDNLVAQNTYQKLGMQPGHYLMYEQDLTGV